MQDDRIILFICVGNSGRSQMAEGLFNSKAPIGYRAISAGIKPTKEINPLVTEVMNEIGIDISMKKPKAVEDWMYKDSERIILMGCSDNSCPVLFRDKIKNWQIEDIKGKGIEEIRMARDHIENKINALISQLKNR
jgi:protein-tyrosine-phosphatase